MHCILAFWRPLRDQQGDGRMSTVVCRLRVGCIPWRNRHRHSNERIYSRELWTCSSYARSSMDLIMVIHAAYCPRAVCWLPSAGGGGLLNHLDGCGRALGRAKSVTSIGVHTGNWSSLKQAALLNAPDIPTTKGCATAPYGKHGNGRCPRFE
jgi:hypothetical protein